ANRLHQILQRSAGAADQHRQSYRLFGWLHHHEKARFDSNAVRYSSMSSTESVRTTRLAPSPTGALHLGNARTFLANWALARQRGWRIVLRIEDLDGPRIKPGADQQAIDILNWLGIDWDEGPTWQRADLTAYTEALAKLAAQ